MESSNDLLESLPEAQQLQVYELMGIANIEDGNVAAKLLIECDYDINRAVQRWFDRHAGGIHDDSAFTTPPTQTATLRPNTQNIPQQRGNQESELHVKYKKLLEKKVREEEEKGVTDTVKQGVGALVSGFKFAWNSVVPLAIRGETIGGEQFWAYLKKNYNDLLKDIKLNMGTLEENARQAIASNKPLLVYIHVDGATHRAIPNNLFKNKNLLNLVNNKFHLLGLLSNTEEGQKITKYIESRHYPCLAVFRMNILEEIVLVEFIPLTNETTADQVREQLLNIERNYYLLLAEEEKVKQDVQRARVQQEIRNFQMNNPFLYGNQFHDPYEEQEGGQMFGFFGAPQPQRPQIRPEEQQRLEEARILRQLQEEEFKEVERKIMEQQNKQFEDEKAKKEKEEQERIARQIREEEEKREEAKRELKKKLKNQVLPEEPAEGAPDAVLIIFRLPDGNRLERRFRNTDKVQSLYDFVDTKDVQFDSSTVRYDLMQPRPFVCLEDKEKTIGEYFEGSDHEVIHLREHTA